MRLWFSHIGRASTPSAGAGVVFMKGRWRYMAMIAIAVVFAACGNDDTSIRSEPMPSDAAARTKPAPPVPSAPPTLECLPGEGQATHTFAASPTTKGRATVGAAVREATAYSLPGHRAPVPETPPELETARSDDAYYLAARRDRQVTVALREDDRVVASISVGQTDSGGWLADELTVCASVLERSRA